MIVQIYVDDIIFESTIEEEKQRFINAMKSEFSMSMVGELTYFLGLQVKIFEDGIFLVKKNIQKSYEEIWFGVVKGSENANCYNRQAIIRQGWN